MQRIPQITDEVPMIYSSLVYCYLLTLITAGNGNGSKSKSTMWTWLSTTLIYATVALVMTSLYFFDFFYTDNDFLTRTLLPAVAGGSLGFNVLSQFTENDYGEQISGESLGESVEQQQAA